MYQLKSHIANLQTTLRMMGFVVCCLLAYILVMKFVLCPDEPTCPAGNFADVTDL